MLALSSVTRRRPRVGLVRAFALCLCLCVWQGCPSARAAGPQGLNDGWMIDNNGNPLFTASRASAFSSAKAGWIRCGMRLIPGHTTWDSTMLGYYDTVVNNARNAGLSVLILVNNESWPGSQSSWEQNAYETTGGNGDNSYINNFAQNAVVPIVQHFKDRCQNYEIWNEPNVGGSYMYPSNFAQILAYSYADLEYAGIKNGNTIIMGGVSGTGDPYNGYSYSLAGAQYIDDTYNMGVNVTGAFGWAKSHWNTYPLDAVAQHIYIDYDTTTSSGEFGQYISWVRQAYAKYEGSGTGKKTWITEFGWSTTYVSQSTQDQNLVTAFGVIEGGSYNYVTNALWFSYQDNSAANLYFGIVDTNGNHKACYPDFTFWEDYYGYYSNGSLDSNVANYENSRGQAAMGNPYDNGGSPFVHKWTSGSYWANVQDCRDGSHQRLCVQDSGWGTFEINDIHGIWDCYLSHGGIGNDAAKNNEYTSGSGTRQDFGSGHYITWDPTNGTVYH